MLNPLSHFAILVVCEASLLCIMSYLLLIFKLYIYEESLSATNPIHSGSLAAKRLHTELVRLITNTNNSTLLIILMHIFTIEGTERQGYLLRIRIICQVLNSGLLPRSAT